MSGDSPAVSQQKTILERVNLWVVLVIGLGTVGSATTIAIWKFSEWAHRLNDVVVQVARLTQEDTHIKEFIARQSLVSAATNPTSSIPPAVSKRDGQGPEEKKAGRVAAVNAPRLAGAWELKFGGGGIGRVGLTADSESQAEFHGEIPLGNNIPPWKLEGHVTIIGNMAKIRFVTTGEKGEMWRGTGEFIIESPNLLRGWYVDQNGKFDTIDVRRVH